MADEVKIDKHVFQERLSQLVTAWKHDKRSNDALFGGAGSMVILMGKAEESGFQKKNAMHVSLCPSALFPRTSADLVSPQFWLLGYEFPATLMVFTTEALYIVTTAKKGDHTQSPDRLRSH